MLDTARDVVFILAVVWMALMLLRAAIAFSVRVGRGHEERLDESDLTGRCAPWNPDRPAPRVSNLSDGIDHEDTYKQTHSHLVRGRLMAEIRREVRQHPIGEE